MPASWLLLALVATLLAAFGAGALGALTDYHEMLTLADVEVLLGEHAVAQAGRNRKVWRRYARFDSADHWEAGVVPCPGDRVLFPKDLRGAPAFLETAEAAKSPHGPSVIEVRELVLPWRGEVVLPLDGRLVVGGDAARSRACLGKDVRWRTPPTPSWLDPANWEAAELDGDPEAVPHLERIPCGQDLAHFKGPAFQVQMPPFRVRVGALYVAETRLALAMHRGWLNELRPNMVGAQSWMRPEDALRLMAEDTGRLTDGALGQQCGLPADGVGDAEAEAELLEGVCQHVACPTPACARPVRPYLHCCDVCGAVLAVQPIRHLEDVRSLVHGAEMDFLAASRGSSPASGLSVHVGAVPSQGLVQVVVLGDASEDFATMIAGRIRSKEHGLELWVSLVVSGATLAPATLSSVMGTLLGSLLIVLLGLAILVYVKERPTHLSQLLPRKQSPYLFARFENAPGDEDNGVAVDVVRKGASTTTSTAVGVRSARGSWSARSFRNPLYEQPVEKETPSAPTMSMSTTTFGASPSSVSPHDDQARCYNADSELQPHLQQHLLLQDTPQDKNSASKQAARTPPDEMTAAGEDVKLVDIAL